MRPSRSCAVKGSIRDVAESLGVSQQSLRAWLKQTQLDAGERNDGLSSDPDS